MIYYILFFLNNCRHTHLLLSAHTFQMYHITRHPPDALNWLASIECWIWLCAVTLPLSSCQTSDPDTVCKVCFAENAGGWPRWSSRIIVDATTSSFRMALISTQMDGCLCPTRWVNLLFHPSYWLLVQGSPWIVASHTFHNLGKKCGGTRLAWMQVDHFQNKAINKYFT